MFNHLVTSSMLNKAYTFSLNFLIFFNVLYIKYKNEKLSVSKFQIIKSILLILIATIWLIIASHNDTESHFVIALPSKISKFSKSFFELVHYVPLGLSLTHGILQLMLQNSIAKVFNYFLTFKKLADGENFLPNFSKFKVDIWKATLVFGFCLISLFISVLSNLIDFISLFYSSIDFSGLITSSFSIGSIGFLCAVLIHFDFLIENLIDIIEEKLRKYYHKHDDCEEFLCLFNQIHELFKIFNKSFGALITVFTTNLVINLFHLVSIFFI